MATRERSEKELKHGAERNFLTHRKEIMISTSTASPFLIQLFSTPGLNVFVSNYLTPEEKATCCSVSKDVKKFFIYLAAQKNPETVEKTNALKALIEKFNQIKNNQDNQFQDLRKAKKFIESETAICGEKEFITLKYQEIYNKLIEGLCVRIITEIASDATEESFLQGPSFFKSCYDQSKKIFPNGFQPKNTAQHNKNKEVYKKQIAQAKSLDHLLDLFKTLCILSPSKPTWEIFRIFGEKCIDLASRERKKINVLLLLKLCNLTNRIIPIDSEKYKLIQNLCAIYIDKKMYKEAFDTVNLLTEYKTFAYQTIITRSIGDDTPQAEEAVRSATSKVQEIFQNSKANLNAFAKDVVTSLLKQNLNDSARKAYQHFCQLNWIQKETKDSLDSLLNMQSGPRIKREKSDHEPIQFTPSLHVSSSSRPPEEIAPLDFFNEDEYVSGLVAGAPNNNSSHQPPIELPLLEQITEPRLRYPISMDEEKEESAFERLSTEIELSQPLRFDAPLPEQSPNPPLTLPATLPPLPGQLSDPRPSS